MATAWVRSNSPRLKPWPWQWRQSRSERDLGGESAGLIEYRRWAGRPAPFSVFHPGPVRGRQHSSAYQHGATEWKELEDHMFRSGEGSFRMHVSSWNAQVWFWGQRVSPAGFPRINPVQVFLPLPLSIPLSRSGLSQWFFCSHIHEHQISISLHSIHPNFPDISLLD